MTLEIEQEMQIKCVSEMLEFAKSNALREYHEKTNSTAFYRGQSDYKWHLVPSVYRDGQFEYEPIYIKEMERIRPDEFKDCDCFGKLVKMQHYGLPTRLLDITMNPLVALYFACRTRQSVDGAFYHLSSPTFWPDNDAIKIVAEYATEHKSFSELAKENREKVIHSLGVPAHVVLPPYTNERIKQQKGAFLIFGMTFRKPNEEAREYIPQYCEITEEQEKLICPEIKKVRIPAENKKTIMKELELLGVDEGTLFPELENQSRNVVKSVRDAIRKM